MKRLYQPVKEKASKDAEPQTVCILSREVGWTGVDETAEKHQEERVEVDSHVSEWLKWRGSAEFEPVILSVLLSAGHSALGTENKAVWIVPRQGGAKPNPLGE